MGTVQYNENAFTEAQNALQSALDVIEEQIEVLSSGSIALLGEIEGPTASVETCAKSLLLQLTGVYEGLEAMKLKLATSMAVMQLTDNKLARTITEAVESAAGEMEE